MSNDEQLLERFVAIFESLDDMNADLSLSPVGAQLAIGDKDDEDWKRWRPLRASTALYFLEVIYAKLPARFPPLFERLVLSYRWAEVDLQSYRLLANPPGPDLSGLLQEMCRDGGLWDALLPAVYIQFGRGPDIDYDPVCFDIKSRDRDGDYRIVKIDHEEILCNYRVKVVAELSRSFRMLQLQTLKEGELR